MNEEVLGMSDERFQYLMENYGFDPVFYLHFSFLAILLDDAVRALERGELVISTELQEQFARGRTIFLAKTSQESST